jgi:anaerobic selenocysteine-containing dehydrogenase
MATVTYTTTCYMCACRCGIKVTLEADRLRFRSSVALAGFLLPLTILLTVEGYSSPRRGIL